MCGVSQESRQDSPHPIRCPILAGSLSQDPPLDAMGEEADLISSGIAPGLVGSLGGGGLSGAKDNSPSGFPEPAGPIHVARTRVGDLSRRRDRSLLRSRPLSNTVGGPGTGPSPDLDTAGRHPGSNPKPAPMRRGAVPPHNRIGLGPVGIRLTAFPGRHDSTNNQPATRRRAGGARRRWAGAARIPADSPAGAGQRSAAPAGAGSGRAPPGGPA
jgi:hypothetical protein